MPGSAEPSPSRPVAWLLLATAAMTLLMVVIGGITRLTESGLSITQWQPVEGVLPPLSAASWQAAFERYQQIPEYRQLHYGMSLEAFKAIFFWEWLHRLLGRLTGLVGLACALAALRFEPRAAWPRYLVVPVLVGLQGLLGWYMVQSGLSVRTSVSQYRLTAHLATALLLYLYCLWQAAGGLAPRRAEAAAGRRFRLAVRAVFGLAALTVLAGGLTAGTRAGLVYNTFPLMDGRLIPAGYLQLTPWWLNPLENPTAIQFDHRVLALSTFAAIIALQLWSRFLPLARGTRRTIACLALIGTLQVGLGISTLLLAVPIPLAAAHQAGAVLLLTAALILVRRTSARSNPDPVREPRAPAGLPA